MDANAVKYATVPISLIFAQVGHRDDERVWLTRAQEDKAFSDSTRDLAIKNSETLSIPHEHKIYPDTTHGFAARPVERVMQQFKQGERVESLTGR